MKGAKIFTLNDCSLYLKENLVTYEMIPLLFVCEDDDKNLYSIIRKYIDEEEYIIVQNKADDIVKMLNNEITMRSLFLMAEEYWDVTIVDGMEDTSDKKSISEIDMEELPPEDAYFGESTLESRRLAEELNFYNRTKESSFVEMAYDMHIDDFDMFIVSYKNALYKEKLYKSYIASKSQIDDTGYIIQKKAKETSRLKEIKGIENPISPENINGVAA